VAVNGNCNGGGEVPAVGSIQMKHAVINSSTISRQTAITTPQKFPFWLGSSSIQCKIVWTWGVGVEGVWREQGRKQK